MAHFAAHRGDLSEDSQRRLETNPLRILDSKEWADQALVAGAPAIDDYMSQEAGAFFEAVQKGLQASGVAFVRQPRLVRGFDYYRHTAFEFVTDRLGAQGTVIGGGRYDGLIEAMGGPTTPAVGWAGGIERLMELVDAPKPKPVDYVFIPLSKRQLANTATSTSELRIFGSMVDVVDRGSFNKRYEKARKIPSNAIIEILDSEQEKVDFLLHIRPGTFDNKITVSDIKNNLCDYLSKSRSFMRVEGDDRPDQLVVRRRDK